MNFKYSFGLFLCALLFTINVIAQSGRFDTLIVYKQLTKEQAARRDSIKQAKECIAESQLKQEQTASISAIDSSRFVKRKTKERNGVSSFSKVPFIVNRSIFGIYTDYINKYVNDYHLNFGGRISRLQASNKAHFKLIENIMNKHSVPREMKALAIIESAMNCNAVSPVGAVGTWQFMEGTAKMMGLRVDQEVDERRDFYKSTNAAAKYLKRLHSMFHDWLLVIASYNCGPAPVLRAINSGKGRSFWDIKPKLPKETQNHVMAFIATNAYLDKFTSVLNMGEVPKLSDKEKSELAKTSKKSIANTSPKPTLKSGEFVSSKKNEESSGEVADDVEQEIAKPKFSKEEMESMAILKVKGVYNLESISKVLDEDVVKLRRWNPTFDEEISKSTSPVHLRLPILKIEKFIIDRERIMAESKR